MEPVERPTGYLIDDDKAAKAILAVEAELLESEGIDPAWPGFQNERGEKRPQDGA